METPELPDLLTELLAVIIAILASRDRLRTAANLAQSCRDAYELGISALYRRIDTTKLSDRGANAFWDSPAAHKFVRELIIVTPGTPVDALLRLHRFTALKSLTIETGSSRAVILITPRVVSLVHLAPLAELTLEFDD